MSFFVAGQLRRVRDLGGGRAGWVVTIADLSYQRTPSFMVYPGDRGTWCYGCGRGGADVIAFASVLWDRPTTGPGFRGLVADVGRALLRTEIAA